MIIKLKHSPIENHNLDLGMRKSLVRYPVDGEPDQLDKNSPFSVQWPLYLG